MLRMIRGLSLAYGRMQFEGQSTLSGVDATSRIESVIVASSANGVDSP